MAARDVLLDAGPLVAVLDPRDQWHAQVRHAWPALMDRCLTTEAVVTEASHLIGRGGGDPAVPLEFVIRAGIPVVPLQGASLRRALALMRKYRDVPMDYADATLVVVSEALGLRDVFTLDRRGFAVYRSVTRGFVVTP